MSEPSRLAKITFVLPFTKQHGGSDWEIVVDGYPVDDFTDKGEVTLELPVGMHELALRRSLLGFWHSRSQILNIELSEQQPVVVKLGAVKWENVVALVLLPCLIAGSLAYEKGLFAGIEYGKCLYQLIL
jgi:hypothetical protein